MTKTRTQAIEAALEQIAPRKVAHIREEECIGCTKCLAPCPFDSIIGGPKLMHTVITDICTGCELCVAPCPVDCIEMIAMPERTAPEKKHFESVSRKRYAQHEARLQKEKIKDRKAYLDAKQIAQKQTSLAERKLAIQAILKRTQTQKALSTKK